VKKKKKKKKKKKIKEKKKFTNKKYMALPLIEFILILKFQLLVISGDESRLKNTKQIADDHLINLVGVSGGKPQRDEAGKEETQFFQFEMIR
jgi:hypothetical protein